MIDVYNYMIDVFKNLYGHEILQITGIKNESTFHLNFYDY